MHMLNKCELGHSRVDSQVVLRSRRATINGSVSLGVRLTSRSTGALRVALLRPLVLIKGLDEDRENTHRHSAKHYTSEIKLSS